MGYSMEQLKDLREKTGAGISDCKNALEEAKGNMEEAVKVLRMKGLATAAKKAGRTAKEGLIGYYIHDNHKIGVMIELRCESDFVAKTPQFQGLAKDLAMQIAAMSPRFVKVEDVSPEVIEAEKAIYREQLKDEKKPAAVLDKIIEGKVNKFFEDTVLLEQTFVKDNSQKVKDLLGAVVAALNENIQIHRFVRYQVGEEA
jgi:elongation factor Ts